MTKTIQKYNKIILIFILLALCVSIALVGGTSKVAEAAASPVWTEEIVIAHITDTHYYPVSYLYKGTNQTILNSQVLDRKLTSEVTYWDNLRAVMEMKPDYLVVSGDNSHNGERQSHIDVANGLRSLQEDMRTIGGKPNFQVFVVSGNHDVYNGGTYDYSTGSGVRIPNVTRKDFSIIYSSLGFPDITDVEAQAFYTTEEYTGAISIIDFVNSTTAPDVDIVWNFNEAQEDYVQGELTYLAKTGRGVTFVGLDIPISNKDDGHVTGGIFTPNIKVFMDANRAAYASEYFVGIAHHSIVEHMEYQEEFITSFVVRDWVNVADYLADYGMRYVFTGHVHSSDIAHRVSFNNNQITDIETSASLSYAAMVRYATVKSGTLGGLGVQDLFIQNDMLKVVDITRLYDGGYITRSAIQAQGLEEFFDIGDIAGDKTINDFQGFTTAIFLEGIWDMVNTYVNPSVLGTLKEMLSGVISGISFAGINLGTALGGKINDLVDVLVSEINTKVLVDYEYKGTKPGFDDNKIFGYLDDLVEKIKTFDLVGDVDIIDYVMYIYTNYAGGKEVASKDLVPAEITAVTESMRNGAFPEQLFNMLLDKEEGLYYLIKGLLETPIDISSVEGMPALISLIGTLIGYKTSEPLDSSNIVLGEVALKALDSSLIKNLGIDFDLGGKTVMGFLDSMLEDYLTHSLYLGLGEILANVAEAFYLDDSFDGNTVKTKILLEAGDKYTYLAPGRVDVPTIENGKVPAKLTVTFGNNTATTKNFSWLTDRRVTAGAVQYMEKSLGAFDSSKASAKTGQTVIYGSTKGLIDVGLFAQLGYTEMARHTAKVTGLKAGTEYSYRVGWPERNYWSEIYTFKTAPEADDAPFEILLISDPQGYTAEAYARVGNLLGAAGEVFDNGYSFVVNTGDLVENSRNTTQFNYYLDVLRPYFANTTQVVANGNHDQYSFKMKEEYEAYVSSSQVYLEEYNYTLMNFNFNLPLQNTTTGAYYSYDYSGVHFTVLNTNDTTVNGMSTGQINWLKADLEGTEKKHKVVMMHKSLYSAGPHIKDVEILAMREQLSPIFAENGVNLVLSGHDHTYSETYYIDAEGNKVTSANNKTTQIGETGTKYVNLGTVGDKYYKYQESDDVPVYIGTNLHDPYLANPTFGKLTFDGENLFYQGYQYDEETNTAIAIDAPSSLSTENLIVIAVVSMTVAFGAVGLSVGIGRIARRRK